MVVGDYEFWRKTTLQDIEQHGHQETLNWLLMLGAMAELGGRKQQEARFVESWLTNANKVFAVSSGPSLGKSTLAQGGPASDSGQPPFESRWRFPIKRRTQHPWLANTLLF
jgi:hypothetical protein